MRGSHNPMSDQTQALIKKMNQTSTFGCKFASLVTIHNYLMFLRDKSVSNVKDNDLSLLDIRQKSSYDEQRIFKYEWFDLTGFAQELEKGSAEFKKYVL